MPDVRLFLDANLLIYLRDSSSPAKQRAAQAWFRDMAAHGIDPLVSWQTLREYYNVVTRKTHVRRSRIAARRDVAAYREWLAPDPYDDFPEAWRIEETFGFSFYDSLMVASAIKAGATHLLTEDLQHDQLVDNLRVTNPFKASFAELSAS